MATSKWSQAAKSIHNDGPHSYLAARIDLTTPVWDFFENSASVGLGMGRNGEVERRRIRQRGA
jgi:hypothetical protein